MFSLTTETSATTATAPASRRRPAPSANHAVPRCALVTAFVAVALLSFVWTPYPPNELHLTNRLAPPGTPGFYWGPIGRGATSSPSSCSARGTPLYVSVVSTIVALITAAIGLASPEQRVRYGGR